MFPILREAGVFAYVHLLLFLPALLWASVCAVLLGLRRRVPPLVAGAPLLVVPLLLGVGMLWAYRSVSEALVLTEPSMRATLVAAGVSEALAQGWFAILVLPGAIVLGLGGLAAGVRGPRSWGVPGLVFAAAGLTALLPAAGLFFDAPLPYVIAKVALYGLGVVPLALATANAHPRGNGPEGGMAAAMAWISVVAATELTTVDLQWTKGFAAVANVDPENRQTILDLFVDEVGRQASLGWAVLALSAVPALICAFRSGPTPTEEELLAGEATVSPGRSLGRMMALAVWVFWAFAMASSSPASALEAIAGR